MKYFFQLITPVAFMLFFVNTAVAQSETKCDPKECNVKCCTPKTCAELVSTGKCTPEQVAACKASGETKVASAIKVKNEAKSASCVKMTSNKVCGKKETNACAPSSSKLVLVEKLNLPKIKPVTKDR